MSLKSLDPDERCQICDNTRDDHGDMNHRFSTDGQLVPLNPGPNPKKNPPKHRDEQSNPDHVAQSLATLLEVLVEKNIINARDVIRIFSGQG